IVLPPPGEIENGATWDLLRDNFLGSGHSFADSVPHALEYALHGLGMRGDVLVHGLEVGLGHRNSSLLTRLQRAPGAAVVPRRPPRATAAPLPDHRLNAMSPRDAGQKG